MGYQIKQSTTAYPLVFLMVDSTDHVTAKTGLSPTVTLSKAGGSFASPSGAVTEIANGWYKVAGNATDSGTLGPLILHATGTAADPVDILFEVVAFDPQDSVRLGLTALPNASAAASGGLLISGSNSGTTTLGALTVTGATTLTGAISATNASNDLRVNGVAAGGSGGVLISGSNSGTTTLGALTITGNTLHSGTTTFTGAVTGTNASNDLRINGAVPGASGGIFIAGTNAATTVTTSFTTTFTGNLTGSVGSLTGHTAQTGDSYARLATYASTYFGPTAGYAANTAAVNYIETNTVQGGISTSTTIALNAAGASSSDSSYINCGVQWGSEFRTITAYNGTTKVATVNRAWVTTPTTGTYFITAEQTAPINLAGKFTNDTAQGTDLTAVANDVDAIYTAVISTGVAFSDAHIDQIADTTLRRTMANVELSSYGNTISMGSLYGLVQQAQESNTTAHANKLTIFKTDGTTELGQRTIATDAAAPPITGIS